MRKIRKVEPFLPAAPKRIRVAAYARVSVEKERSIHSLSAQVSYYSELIQNNPEWEYAGVYADCGISGTSIKSRDEFQRLISDCEAGKIDMILTKSISRFARNTVDLLETVRHLKDLGIEVRFEKENINSMSGDGELMLSILASFAQEESRNISENVKWGTRKRFQQGIPNGKFRIYGYRWEGDNLVIVPEEAKIVRRIFQNFLDGKSRLETEKEFAAEDITTRAGKRWVDSNIKNVLCNITYTGNMLLQKAYIADPINHKVKKNKGELPQYLVENSHEPIIDKVTFDYVQSEMARRRQLGVLANKHVNACCFTGKIKCEKCGCSFMHNRRQNRGGTEFWCCGTKKRKLTGGRCESKNITQTVLEKECCAVLGITEFDENKFLSKVEKITIPQKDRVLVFHMKSGEIIRRPWVSTAKRDMWTPERKALWGKYQSAGLRTGTGLSFNEFKAKLEESNGES